MIERHGSALLLLCIAWLPPAAWAQGRITYCCSDDKGRQICSDVLPQQCYGRAYREVNSRGITVKRVEAPLTAEQRAARQAQEKKARQEALQRKEEERRNRALLATYTSEKDIDYMRDRAVADLEKQNQASQLKLQELKQRKQQLDNEAEFYKKRTLPPKLQAQMRDNEAEIKALQAAIEARKRDIEAIRKRYEEEKRRYRELTQDATPPPSGAEARPR